MIKIFVALILGLTSITSLPSIAYNAKSQFVEVEISSLDGLMTLFKKLSLHQ